MVRSLGVQIPTVNTVLYFSSAVKQFSGFFEFYLILKVPRKFVADNDVFFFFFSVIFVLQRK